jgi:hypothetical protein
MRRLVALASLLFALNAGGQCNWSGELKCDGPTVFGRLENATCTFNDSTKPYHVYYIEATAGTVLDIFLSSDAFPPLLGIYFGEDSNPKKYDRGLTIARVTYDVPRTGTYRVVASADNGSRRGVFELDVFCESVCLRPFATGGRDTFTVAGGARVTVTGKVDGSRPLTWRWFDEANPSVTLGTTPDQFVTPAIFTTTTIGVTVTNACGSVTRTAARINVAPCTAAPVITLQPKDWHREDGDFPNFTVVATGSEPLTYDWYEGTPPDTTRPLNIHTPTAYVQQPQHGNVSYWVRVSNGCGYADSVAAELKWYAERRRSVRH